MKADEFTHNYMKVILFIKKFILIIRKDQIFSHKLMLNKF